MSKSLVAKKFGEGRKSVEDSNVAITAVSFQMSDFIGNQAEEKVHGNIPKILVCAHMSLF